MQTVGFKCFFGGVKACEGCHSWAFYILCDPGSGSNSAASSCSQCVFYSGRGRDKSGLCTDTFPWEEGSHVIALLLRWALSTSYPRLHADLYALASICLSGEQNEPSIINGCLSAESERGLREGDRFVCKVLYLSRRVTMPIYKSRKDLLLFPAVRIVFIHACHKVQ